MKASKIRPGDVLPGHYRVLEVRPLSHSWPARIEAIVEYPDGGREYRTWDQDAETPLIREEQAAHE